MCKYKLLGQLEIQGLVYVFGEGATMIKESDRLEDGADPVLYSVKVAKDTRVRNLLELCLLQSI